MFKNIHFLFSLNYESNNLAWNRVKCSIQVQWFIVSNIFCIVFFSTTIFDAIWFKHGKLSDLCFDWLVVSTKSIHMTIIWQFVHVFPRTIKSHEIFDGPCRPSIYEAGCPSVCPFVCPVPISQYNSNKIKSQIPARVGWIVGGRAEWWKYRITNANWLIRCYA